MLAEAHTSGIGWTAALFGQTTNDDVRRTAKCRTAVVIRTFTDLLTDARHRYEEYLRIVAPRRLTPAPSAASLPIMRTRAKAGTRRTFQHGNETVTAKVGNAKDDTAIATRDAIHELYCEGILLGRDQERTLYGPARAAVR